MVQISVKETYEQIGEYEFNRINPYIEAIGRLLHNKPNAKVKKVKTVFDADLIPGELVPMLWVYYDERD